MKRSAFAGGMIWAGVVAASLFGPMLDLRWAARRLGTIELLFLLGPLVVVPLGLELFARLEQDSAESTLIRAARLLQFPAAILVVASFFFERGVLATALVTPWFIVGSLVGCRGLLVLLSPTPKNLKTACVTASFFYLPIGCAWLIASRFGLTPINFQEPIVLLTAVHFHFAGFAAPLMTRAAATVIERGRLLARRTFSVVAAGVLAGPAVLAAGFIVGPRLKVAAALILVASEIGLALFFLMAVRRLHPRWTRVFVTISAASVLGAMCLAAVWAIGEYPLQPFVHLAEMAKFHGTANALGFTLCGLVGWTFSLPEAATREDRGAR
jgi:hypothetical protein